MTLEPTQFAQLVQEVREALSVGSQGVGEVEIVSSLANIVSLPAQHLIGDAEKIVAAPIELLSAPAIDAAAEARKVTDDAVIATVAAKAATDLSDAARKDLDELKIRTILAGENADAKGDKAFRAATITEDATLYAILMASHLQTKLEQAQVVILSGQAHEDTMKNLDSQVKDSIIICASTRDEAYSAILQLRELQMQVAQAIVDAYVAYDGMKLSTAESRQATAIANKATERICELSDRTERVIIESVLQTGEAKQVIIRLEDLAKDVLLSKMDTDIAASHAEANAGLAKQATEDAELAKQESIIVTGEAKKVIEKAEDAAEGAIFSAAGADIAAGYATQQGDAAKMAAERSNILSDHPSKVINDEWYKYDEASGEYVSTGIQAKGNTGSSFSIVGNYDTYEQLIAAVPDGTNVDGVYGVGLEPPYIYYGWTIQDGVWGWHTQGSLQGGRGESAYEGAVRITGYEGTEEEYDKTPIENASIAEEAAKKAVISAKYAEDAGGAAIGSASSADAAASNANGQAERAQKSAEEAELAKLDAIQAAAKANEAAGKAEDAAEGAIFSAAGADAAAGYATEQAEAARLAAERLDTLSDNPNKIVDGVWHKYDEESGEYVSTGIRAMPIDWQVRDLDHVPTEADLTYHDEATGLDVQYPIGAEVRVLDAEKYVFYKLYDITADSKAVWGRVPLNSELEELKVGLSRNVGCNTVNTLVGMPVDKRLVIANLSAATTISLASAMNIGDELSVVCIPSATFNQALPTTGGWTSLDGDSLSLTSGKLAEISILCYGENLYSVSSKSSE